MENSSITKLTTQKTSSEYPIIRPIIPNSGVKLPVNSLLKSLEFYWDILGLKVKKQTSYMVAFNTGLVITQIQSLDENIRKIGFHALLYFEVDNFNNRFSDLKKAGFNILSNPTTWQSSSRPYFRCSDPDENILEVFSIENAKGIFEDLFNIKD